MPRTHTFTLGSGCYVCRSCGRKTRDDGNGDSVNTRTCTDCYELAGIENTISDEGETTELTALAEYYKSQILKKGGVLK